MKIIFAKHIGFCSGVKRAIAIAENSLKQDEKPVQFLGSLVHNEKVLDVFKKKGVKFVTSPKEARPGTLIIQAHGFPPFSRQSYPGLVIRDATCPLVKRAQKLALNLHQKDYQVVIIGERNHDEVKGINGWIGRQAIIVQNQSQARKLPKLAKIGVVVQTTQDLGKVNRLIKILRTKARQFKWFNTICPEVIVRQKELLKITKESDGVLIIGSRTSANTKRLVKIAKQAKKKVFWFNSLEELKKQPIRGVSVLGIVSGTSTPDWEIEKIKKYFND